ncbi:hypothetical protein [Magnetococcus sp. PR-3]|uniref:preprotein translocase subunit SecA n=1 Tax=Magnetococcus sp. PR-3 TaxID=3120355 RepID=UPI002FCDFBEE
MTAPPSHTYPMFAASPPTVATTCAVQLLEATKQKLGQDPDVLLEAFTAWQQAPQPAAGDHQQAQQQWLSGAALLFALVSQTAEVSMTLQSAEALIAVQQGKIVLWPERMQHALIAVLHGVLLQRQDYTVYLLLRNDAEAQSLLHALHPLLSKLTIPLAHVAETSTLDERRQAHKQAIVLTTTTQLMNDHLHDRFQTRGLIAQTQRRRLRYLLGKQEETLLRPLLQCALVLLDADHLLLDEATTPHMLSVPAKNDTFLEALQTMHNLARELKLDQDYLCNHKHLSIALTPKGQSHFEQLVTLLPGIWQGPQRGLELLNYVLKARHFFERGQTHSVDEASLQLLDPFTQRPVPQRMLELGLHQALEIREGLPPTPPSETLARLNFSHFLSGFPQVSGLCATAQNETSFIPSFYHYPVQTIAPVVWPTIHHLSTGRLQRACEQILKQAHRPHFWVGRSLPLLQTVKDLLTDQNIPLCSLFDTNGADTEDQIYPILLTEQQWLNLAPELLSAHSAPAHVLYLEPMENRRQWFHMLAPLQDHATDATITLLLSPQAALFKQYLPNAIYQSLQLLSPLPIPGYTWLMKGLTWVAQQRAKKIRYLQLQAIQQSHTHQLKSLGFGSSVHNQS